METSMHVLVHFRAKNEKRKNMHVFIHLVPWLVCSYWSFAVVILRLGLQFDGRCVFNNSLDGHLDELVKRVQLLPHQPLLVKIGAKIQT